MFYLLTFGGLVLHSILAFLSFDKLSKQTEYYFMATITFAALANAIWFYLAQKTVDVNKLVFYALVWDVMITSVYLIVPFVLFQVKFNNPQIVGLCVTIFGLILMKVH